MLKKDEIATPTSCLNRAEELEPVFVLIGRDACAPSTVEHWAASRILLGKNEKNDPQIVEAMELARKMRFWYRIKKEQSKEQ